MQWGSYLVRQGGRTPGGPLKASSLQDWIDPLHLEAFDTTAKTFDRGPGGRWTLKPENTFSDSWGLVGRLDLSKHRKSMKELIARAKKEVLLKQTLGRLISHFDLSTIRTSELPRSLPRCRNTGQFSRLLDLEQQSHVHDQEPAGSGQMSVVPGRPGYLSDGKGPA